jgi:hypothetical protein
MPSFRKAAGFLLHFMQMIPGKYIFFLDPGFRRGDGLRSKLRGISPLKD